METLVIAVLVVISLLLAIGILLLLRRSAPAHVDSGQMLDDLTSKFSQVSFDALAKAQTSFLELADTRFKSLAETSGAELDGKKNLIDQQLTEMKTELGKVTTLVGGLERDREKKFGELTAQLKSVGEQTSLLTATTSGLRETLSNTRVRGQWGERMAEDVLRLIGFVEGVNYHKQKTSDGSRSRPDFTFLLPRDQNLNMDVKFPLDNYLKFVGAETQPDLDRFRADFLRDVRNRLKEVVTRDYISAEQKTLGCVLMFIPNEQIYHFIQEQDAALMDEALKNQVVLCSPMSLFAILVVIRQAVDNFTFEQTSNQIVAQVGAFKKQWETFTGAMDAVGKRIEDTQKSFETLVGRRRRALERPLNRIEAMRLQRDIPLPDDSSDSDDELAFDPVATQKHSESRILEA